MSQRVLKVYASAGFGSKDIPVIHLQGRWLEKLGFTIGKRFTVLESPGKLIITLVKEEKQEGF